MCEVWPRLYWSFYCDVCIEVFVGIEVFVFDSTAWLWFDIVWKKINQVLKLVSFSMKKSVIEYSKYVFKKIYRKVSEKTNTIISLQDLKYFLWIFWNIFSNLFWFCLSGGAEARRWQEVESAANFNVVKWFLKIERIFS